MNKNKESHPLSQKTIIIDKYDNDQSRVGDYIVISIMSNGKRITIVEVYNQMVKGFDNVNKRLDKNDDNWARQHEFNKQQLEWNKKLIKINNLKDPDDEK